MAESDDLVHALDGWWIHNNLSFLARYWRTVTEALERVASDPDSFAEFHGNQLGDNYVEAVLENHMDNHNYSGLLLAYANFDEFMTVLARRLGEASNAQVGLNELSDRGVKRYRKFIHDVCGVDPDQTDIDWAFLTDLGVVRNAIIHANGNRSLTKKPQQLTSVVDRHRPKLLFKHQSKLVVTEEFVLECMVGVGRAALAVNALVRSARATASSE